MLLAKANPMGGAAQAAKLASLAPVELVHRAFVAIGEDRFPIGVFLDGAIRAVVEVAELLWIKRLLNEIGQRGALRPLA